MTVYRTGAFMIKGLQSFTKNGYNNSSKNFKSGDLDVDLTGVVVMITGANSGIGKAAAIALASRGAEIHMVCRNMERANAAKDEIVTSSSNEKVFVHQLDMSNTGDVYNFVTEFNNDHDQLNVLVNNAGCMVHERKLVPPKQLVEMNFATNTLGTYVLTEQLLPLMKQSQSPRVITVASGGMYLEKLNSKDLQSLEGKFDGQSVYAHNKRQQVILNEEWGKMHEEVQFSCMHPGWADTPAVRTSMPDFHRRLKDKLRTPEEGADTIVWLAASKSATALQSGLFYLDRTPRSTHLPLACTHENVEDRKVFLSKIEELAKSLKPL